MSATRRPLLKRRIINSAPANPPPRLKIQYHPHTQYLLLYHEKAATDGPLVLDLFKIRGTHRILLEIVECSMKAPELLPKFLRALDYILTREFRYTLSEICQRGYWLNWDTGLVEFRD